MRIFSIGAAAAIALLVLALWLAPGADEERTSTPIPEARTAAVADGDPQSQATPPAAQAATQAPAAARTEVEGAGAAGPEEVRGRVVDDATGQPVPELVLAVTKRGREHRTTTAADGGFALEGLSGLLSFVARLPGDGPRVSLVDSSHRVRAGDPPLELRAQIGPRYRVELVGPREALEASWTASVVARPPGAPRDLPRLPARPLEDGEPRTVRFPAPPVAPDAGEVYLLVLRDASGEWYGEAPVPAWVGAPDDVLQVQVDQRGLLTGRVVEEDGEPPADPTTVHVQPAGQEPWPAVGGEWQVARLDAEGAFRFEGLDEGDHHVMIAPSSRPMLHQRVYVPAGRHDMGTIVLPGGGEPGVVAGVVRSATGQDGVSVLLHLESLDGTGWARSWFHQPPDTFALFYGVGPAQASQGVTEFAFRFEGVPAGRYRLVVVPWDGFRYEPTELELQAPVEGLEVLRQDSGGRVGVGFEVVDAESGEPLGEFMARFHTGRWGKEKSLPHRSGEVLGRIAPDGDVRWAVFAAGHAPVWGDAGAFAGLGDPAIARVELERGWGADLSVRDGRDPRRYLFRAASVVSVTPPGCVPLAGVRVLADGRPVGVTDDAGRCRVVLEAAPERLDLERAGWVVVPTTTFADGRVLLDCPSPEVWMVPAE